MKPLNLSHKSCPVPLEALGQGQHLVVQSRVPGEFQVPPIPSISHPSLAALLLKFPCMAPHLPHFIYFIYLFCGTAQTAPPAPALRAWSPKEEQPGVICIPITGTLLQAGCPECQSRGNVAAMGDRDAADGALVPVTACLMGGGRGAADPARHLCTSGTASRSHSTAPLHLGHCILQSQHLCVPALHPASTALHLCVPLCIHSAASLRPWHCITLAAASVTGMLEGSRAGTHIVLSPWSVGQQELSRLSCSQGASTITTASAHVG